MDPKPYIQNYGGKAGGIFFLKDIGGFEENLLPIIAYLDRDQSFSKIEKYIPERFDKDVIVRASHRNDYWGLVDVLKTIKNVKTKTLSRKTTGEAKKKVVK